MSEGTEPEAPERELEVADTPDAKLVAALAAAQAEFPAIAKNRTGEVRGTNKQGQAYNYTYQYADLGDVLAAVRPILARHGLAITQPTRPDGLLRTELKHVGGATLASEVNLGRDAGNPQAFGGALTYLRRYELVTLLGIAAEEDTDARDVPNTGAGAPTSMPALPSWASMLTDARVRDELGPRLRLLLGDEGAKAVYRLIRDSLDGVPAVVVPVLGAVIEYLINGDDAELSNRLDDERSARANSERAAQDAAAEAPDAPAPESTDAGHEERIDDAATAAAEPTDAGDEEADRAAQQVRDAGGSEEAATAASEGVRRAFSNPEATAKLDAMAEEHRAAEEASAKAQDAPAGKTPAPDLSALDGDEAIAALRAAGCVCKDPLVAMTVESARDTTCPIIGHGIPF